MVLIGMGLFEHNSWGSLPEGFIRMGLNGVNRNSLLSFGGSYRRRYFSFLLKSSFHSFSLNFHFPHFQPNVNQLTSDKLLVAPFTVGDHRKKLYNQTSFEKFQFLIFRCDCQRLPEGCREVARRLPGGC